jgi:hypothetical protein
LNATLRLGSLLSEAREESVPMKRLVTSLVLAGALAALPAAAEVDVHIGIPAPQIVIQAPPRLVVVPDDPAVRYAPDLGYEYFAYGGAYYTVHGGRWFRASAYNGPWTYVETPRVPRQVVVVPSRYYRDGDRYVRRGHPHGMPPGQAKKYYGKHKHKRHHHHDDD